ncbi:hypothetical protein ACFY05_27455 [Microtetraspora fusca]|uniref:Uncharacterized protein n=1 Tax=Microtetraspora fusca TaxID=1997 RepID=A0ABW6VE82_MICFU
MRQLGDITGCHGLRVERDRSHARVMGRLVPHGEGFESDPARVPITLRSGRRVLLGAVELVCRPPVDGVLYAAAG